MGLIVATPLTPPPPPPTKRAKLCHVPLGLNLDIEQHTTESRVPRVLGALAHVARLAEAKRVQMLRTRCEMLVNLCDKFAAEDVDGGGPDSSPDASAALLRGIVPLRGLRDQFLTTHRAALATALNREVHSTRHDLRSLPLIPRYNRNISNFPGLPFCVASPGGRAADARFARECNGLCHPRTSRWQRRRTARRVFWSRRLAESERGYERGKEQAQARTSSAAHATVGRLPQHLQPLHR